MRVSARYNTPDSNGETRRDRNERFGVKSPDLHLPERGRYLVEWYGDATGCRRYEQGLPHVLTHSEWLAWAQMTGELVRPPEWAVLRDMDAAYVQALREEIGDQRAREAESKTHGRHSKAGA